jgi:hypothetical protein
MKNKKIYLFSFILLFLFSTLYFVFQHSKGLSWDFSVYVLNAKYIFAKGFYFEWERPPLLPFIIGIFRFIGWNAAKYLSVILISALYLFATYKLSLKLKINPLLFYALSLTPFFIGYGVLEGTELLSLALIMLCILFILEDKPILSGVFLSLCALTRYNNFIFFPLLFFHKNLKKIFLSLLSAFVIFFPWLLFNFFKSGNFLTSILNSYALNVLIRKGIMNMPFSFKPLLINFAYYLIFFILGFIISIKEKKYRNTNFYLMILFLALAFYSYYSLPMKVDRYLFLLILPITYFSAIFFKKYEKKKLMKIILIIIVILGLSVSIFFLAKLDLVNPEYYKSMANKTGSCMLKSNAWVFFDAVGKPAEPFPKKERLLESINNGDRILMLKYISDPDYIKDLEFLKSLPMIEETPQYYLLGNSSLCSKERAVNQTFLSMVRGDGIIDLSKYPILKNIP